MATDLLTTLSPEMRAEVDRYLDERMDERIKEIVRAELAADPARNMCRIIASKGTMDMAYPPLILASAAAALGMDTAIFFTFYGLELLKKDMKLKLDPIGNPAMPMPMPNLIAVLPGMRSAATLMMDAMFKRKGVASLSELREACTEAGVRLIACRMTFDVMGYKEADIIEGCEYGGAAAFLSEASRAHVTLFVESKEALAMKPERVDATLDARGMLCPMPIVKSNKAIDPLQHGQVLEVLATDKGSCVDVPAWCSARRHTLLHTDTDGQVYRFYIKKGN